MVKHMGFPNYRSNDLVLNEFINYWLIEGQEIYNVQRVVLYLSFYNFYNSLSYYVYT